MVAGFDEAMELQPDCSSQGGFKLACIRQTQRLIDLCDDYEMMRRRRPEQSAAEEWIRDFVSSAQEADWRKQSGEKVSLSLWVRAVVLNYCQLLAL